MWDTEQHDRSEDDERSFGSYEEHSDDGTEDMPQDHMSNKHYFSDDSDDEKWREEKYGNFKRETEYTDETYKKIQRGRKIYSEILNNLKPWSYTDSDSDDSYNYYLIPFQYYDRADIITAIYAPKDTVFYIMIEDNILYSNDTEYIGDISSSCMDKINNEKQLEDILNIKNLSISQTESILKMGKNINISNEGCAANHTFAPNVIMRDGKEYYRHVIATPFLPCYSMPRICISSKFLNSMLYIENIAVPFVFTSYQGFNKNNVDPYIISIQNKLYYNDGCLVPLREDCGDKGNILVDEYDEKYRGHVNGQDIFDVEKGIFNLTTVSFESWGNRELNNESKIMYHNLFVADKFCDD